MGTGAPGDAASEDGNAARRGTNGNLSMPPTESSRCDVDRDDRLGTDESSGEHGPVAAGVDAPHGLGRGGLRIVRVVGARDFDPLAVREACEHLEDDPGLRGRCGLGGDRRHEGLGRGHRLGGGRREGLDQGLGLRLRDERRGRRCGRRHLAGGKLFGDQLSGMTRARA